MKHKSKRLLDNDSHRIRLEAVEYNKICQELHQYPFEVIKKFEDIFPADPCNNCTVYYTYSNRILITIDGFWVKWNKFKSLMVFL